jgi:UDP-N-acetylmuramoyl-L-alanine---L-glutamate ligase
VPRLSGFADLAGATVGVWGVGVEGEATARRLALVGATAVLVDDAPKPGRDVLATNDGGLAALARCDVVLKSPGIPTRRGDVESLRTAGVVVTSALNLWLLETDRSRVIGITGTKGKSTTTALATFALTACGQGARATGNIGQPPYDPEAPDARWTVVEISSFQAVALDASPATVVVTSLGADHLDWHGDLAQYYADKLSLTRADGAHVTLLADCPDLLAERGQIGGEVRVVAATHGALTGRLGLLGAHNVSNVSLAVAAVAQALGKTDDDVAAAMVARADTFTPLPGRLTLVREIGAVRYVDDGLATGPLPTVAALAVFTDVPVAIIVGGYDRGVDYAPLVSALAKRSAPTTLVAMGDAGARIADAVEGAPGVAVVRAADLPAAVGVASSRVDRGVILFSPAAPSFDQYENWRERSAEFERLVRAVSQGSNG